MITSVTWLPPPGLREAQSSLLGQREKSHGMSHARRRTGFANVSAMTERLDCDVCIVGCGDDGAHFTTSHG
jgi:hypothetical protein